jgi:hypothetical protein
MNDRNDFRFGGKVVEHRAAVEELVELGERGIIF